MKKKGEKEPFDPGARDQKALVMISEKGFIEIVNILKTVRKRKKETKNKKKRASIKGEKEHSL